MERSVLELVNIQKSFGGIHALKGIDLRVDKGEVHGLIGENGAGKSTLIKVLTGVHQEDEGEIHLAGEKVQISSPVVARHCGIVAIYQELSLVEQSTIAENLFLGHEPIAVEWLGWVDRRTLEQNAQKYLAEFGLNVDVGAKVSSLSIGAKRIVEILKAVSVNAKILLLDEPTTGMSQAEIDQFFTLLHGIKQKGVTMIYISHHLDEVFRICDRVSVLRNGQNAGTFSIDEVEQKTLIKTMVGKDVEERVGKVKSKRKKPVVLEADSFHAKGMASPLSFQLHEGEVLGITGIIGAGKSELGLGLFGASPQIGGSLRLSGREIEIKNPQDARKHGIAFIPEDRKTQGLFLKETIRYNLAIPNLDSCRNGPFLSGEKIKTIAEDMIEKLLITPPALKMLVGNLSGGNQQKVVIGKWLSGDPKILIMDEPTRGIDVGAKAEIYRLIESLAEQGMSILLLSAEFPEINSLCDRVLVLRDGKIVKKMEEGHFSTECMLSAALGGSDT